MGYTPPPMPVKAKHVTVCAYCGTPHGPGYEPCANCGATATRVIEVAHLDSRYVVPAANVRAEPQ